MTDERNYYYYPELREKRLEPMSEEDKVEVYLNVVNRLEPDLTAIDHSAAMTSIAISLKRIADKLTIIVVLITIGVGSLVAMLKL